MESLSYNGWNKCKYNFTGRNEIRFTNDFEQLKNTTMNAAFLSLFHLKINLYCSKSLKLLAFWWHSTQCIFMTWICTVHIHDTALCHQNHVWNNSLVSRCADIGSQILKLNSNKPVSFAQIFSFAVIMIVCKIENMRPHRLILFGSFTGYEES